MKLLPFLLTWHRRLGLLVAIPVLLWTLSGVFHPIMSRLNPQPVTMGPPAAPTPASHWLAPAHALQQHGIHQAQALRLVTVNHQPFYQVSASGSRHYISPQDGHLLEQGEQQHAVELAAHFAGLAAEQIQAIQHVTRFDDDYLWINRLLPVWRAEFDTPGQLGVYVETAPPRLAAMVDDTKRFNTALFRILHTWEGLPEHPAITVVMTLFLLLATGIGVGGLILYGLLWKNHALPRRNSRLQHWHRSLGISVSIVTCLFALSGAWHLLHTPSAPSSGDSGSPGWQVASLDGLSAAAVWGTQPDAVIIGCATAPCRLVAPDNIHRPEHDHGGNAQPNAAFTLQALTADAATPSLANLAEQAARLALRLPDTLPASEITTVTRFAGEYGFLNKRLPVLKIGFVTDDHPTAYWEPGTGIIASIVRDADRYEGYSFGYLHKYHWLDFAGKNVRDSVNALLALLVALVTGLGMLLWWQRARR